MAIHNNHGDTLENDVCFILTSAFLIFTMQTGYGLLESGTVSRKNEVNILLKNAINIICGSLAFWCFGFAFSSRETDVNRLKIIEFPQVSKPLYRKTATISHGQQQLSTIQNTTLEHVAQFFRVNIVTPNRFFVHITNANLLGTTYVEMAFQLAYATTCTAIISGAMAERCRFFSYLIFSFFSNILFCLPSRWTMFNGWLSKIGVIDIGGSGTIHLVGGCSGLIAAWLLGPRLGRFDGKFKYVPMGNPTNAVHGIILLWWGWLGYNAGSLFGITGDKWKYASRSAVATIMASMAGGAFGMIWSAFTNHGLQDVKALTYSILASLVAISGGAPVFRPIYAIITGVIGSLLTMITIPLLERVKIDDPTDSFSVHAVAGAWGLIAIGLFSDLESVIHYKQDFHENITIAKTEIENLQNFLLLSQLYAILVLVFWSIVITLILLLPIQFTIGLRMPPQEELLGPDFVEHGIVHEGNRLLLNIIKQKIRYVQQDGMSESQASAEVVGHYYEQKRLREQRKRSLTGHRSSTSSFASPNQQEDIWPKFRQLSAMEREQKQGRYYHNHERKQLSVWSILEASNIRSQFKAGPVGPNTSTTPPPWNTPFNISQQQIYQSSILSPKESHLPQTRQPKRKIQLNKFLQASGRVRQSPLLYPSPQEMPSIEN